MKYAQLIDILTSFIKPKAGDCRDLQTVTLLHDILGQPEKKIKKIHIAGTNGKGSVGFKISKAFSLAGYKVGWFSSPHLSSFRERIQINHEYISEEDFAKIGTKVVKKILENSLQPVFFEVIWMMALLYFVEQKVDIAIIETGIGGRLDSTNIITPILSILTTIGYDHLPLLGTSLEDIAYQKAGIIKNNVPVVLGPSAQGPIFLQRAQKVGAQTLFSSDVGGFFDDQNMDIAAVALKFLSQNFSKITDDIICGSVRQRLGGRFEVLPSFMTQRLSQDFQFPEFVVLDVAHNISAIKAVFEAIKLKLGFSKIRVLFGFSNSKNAEEVIRYLASQASGVHLLPIDHPRLEKPKYLQQVFSFVGYEKSHLAQDVKSTLQEAFLLAKAHEEVVLICGSCFIMSDVRKALGFKDVIDEIPSAPRFLSS